MSPLFRFGNEWVLRIDDTREREKRVDRRRRDGERISGRNVVVENTVVVHSFPFDIPVFHAVLTVLPAGVATPFTFTFPRVIDERERERGGVPWILRWKRVYTLDFAEFPSPSFDIF